MGVTAICALSRRRGGAGRCWGRGRGRGRGRQERYHVIDDSDRVGHGARLKARGRETPD